MKKDSLKGFQEFLEEITIQGNPGIPGEGKDAKPGERRYLDELERAEKSRLGIGSDGGALGDIMGLVSQSKQLMSGKEKELEKLAVDVIKELYSDILGDVKLDIQFTDGQGVANFIHDIKDSNLQSERQEERRRERERKREEAKKERDARRGGERRERLSREERDARRKEEERQKEKQKREPIWKTVDDPILLNKIHKAKIANNIIQGEAKNTKRVLHLPIVRDGLNKIFGESIANELFNIWITISDRAEKADWIIPIEKKAHDMEINRQYLAGATAVEWEKSGGDESADNLEEITNNLMNSDIDNDTEDDGIGDLLQRLSDSGANIIGVDGEKTIELGFDSADEWVPVVRARGVDFPMLLHEAVKGIYELIATIIQPGEDATDDELHDAHIVRYNVSSYLDEAEDFRTGPKIAADFRDFINEIPNSDYTQNMRAYILGKMLDESYMDSETFLKTFRGILNKDEWAVTAISNIVNEIVDELKEYERSLHDTSYEIETPIVKEEPESSDISGDDDYYKKLSPSELDSEINKALDSGDFEKVEYLSQFMKSNEGKKIYLNEVKRIRENHQYRNK